MNTDLSIIIVNFNVQYFIEQCLNSIYNISDFKGNFEVIVIDNNSSDESVSMIKSKFPKVNLIVNDQNEGFSIANNQGIRIAKGKYVLLLNPDTILEEKTLSKCYHKMEEDTSIGILGVKMIDGGGNYLPESKRGFPSPMVSLYRFSGIAKIFPKSPVFNKYYFGHIEENQTAEVDILCGAFMFIRSSDLDDVGLLDEDFFMYGEDIDFSYRFNKAGKKVVYFPETRIIHFKGESTKKDSIQYSKNFYNAMDIFAKKHFKDSKAKSFLSSLSTVIKIKGTLNFLASGLRKIALPILDIVVILCGLFLISNIWAKFYFNNINYYEKAPLITNFTLYTVIWVLSLFYSGAYDKHFKVINVIRNVLIGTLIILAIYGLLDEHFRSSRAIIIISNFYVLIAILMVRSILSSIGWEIPKWKNSGKNVLLIASKDEAHRIEAVLNKSSESFNSITALPPSISSFELNEIIKVQKANEVICNVKEIGMEKVISLMSSLGNKVDFKITGDESLAIIGSRSKNKSGEVYTANINYNIQGISNRRMKRTFDLFGSALLILLIPVLIISKNYRKIYKKLIYVLFGQKALIGYNLKDPKVNTLPLIREGLISNNEVLDSESSHSANFDYAKDYNVYVDLKRLIKHLF